MKPVSTLAVATVLAAWLLLAADASGHHAAHQGTQTRPAEQVAPLADGEVRKIDRGAGRLIIKHGPIPNLDMPATTMVFRVKDRAMLEHLRGGDRIKFAVEKIGGTYMVTRIERP